MANILVEQVGAPLGALVLSGSPQALTFQMSNRLNGLVSFIADDAPFLFATTSGGTLSRVPAGGTVTLPVYKTQIWYFQQDAVVTGANLRYTCVG